MAKQSSFSMPTTNLFGAGAIQETGVRLKGAGAKKSIVSDRRRLIQFRIS